LNQEPTEESLEPYRWSRARQWRVSILASGALALAILLLNVSHALFASKPPAAEPSAPPGAFRATPQQLKTFTIEAVGTHAFTSEELTEGKIGVNAQHATPVVSPYSGRVIRIDAALGDEVKAGAPLATIAATEFVQAQNDLKVAASQVKLARINENRKHALYDAKGGSQQDWQQAQADLAAAETAVNSVRNRLRVFGKTDSEIARLETAESIDANAVLSAPLTGVVVDRQIGPGQYLQAGGSPVFTIADLSSVWLLANVRESDAGRVKLGQTLEVSVQAYPARTFRARITYVAAVIDPTTHRLPVRAELDNRDGALKPEMFAAFRILTSAATEATAIPDPAVVYEGDAAHVWVVGADGLISYRTVHTGRRSDGLIEILDGLKAGESVVTRGALFIDQAATPASS
jgi:cobalt-zinc-cadmium efflux system membrane fusion protein